MNIYKYLSLNTLVWSMSNILQILLSVVVAVYFLISFKHLNNLM